jgi:CheY-like chemotaxis protein
MLFALTLIFVIIVLQTKEKQMAKILLVEDNTDIARLMIEYFQITGQHTIVNYAASLKEGLCIAAAADIDFALLNVHLGPRTVDLFFQETSMPIAYLLQSRGIPYVFITGDVINIEPELEQVPVIYKPFHMKEIENIISNFLSTQLKAA